MWWGAAIEAPDPGALAGFYSELLGWPIGHQEPGTAIVAAPNGAFLVFQQADGYVAPVWPPVDGAQRPMVHYDFQVGDLESAVADLKRDLDGDIVVHGSAQLVQALLERDLVDELRLMVFPVVLGSGKRLFGETSEKKPLRLADSKSVGDGVTILVHEPVRE